MKGTLRTRLVTIEGDSLSLNVDAGGGKLRAQILDDRRRAIRGFRFADFTPVQTDEIAAPARWKRSLAEIKGRAVRLEFELERARLFGMAVGN